jgi:hypothetical protein
MIDHSSSVRRKRPIRVADPSRGRDLDAVPPEADCPIRDNGQQRPTSDSVIVFCGDAQQISDGFALALYAMEANAHSLMMSTESSREGDWS